jgi:WD40 repeat protein
MLSLEGHRSTVHALAFAPDGRRLLSAGADGTVRIWDVGEGQEANALTGHAGAVRSIAIDDDGWIASGGDDGKPRLWDLNSAKVIEVLPKLLGPITSVAWSSRRGAQKLLFVAAGERLKTDRPGEIKLWRFGRTAGASSLRLEPQGVWSLAAAAGPIIAWANGSRKVVVWPLSNPEPKTLRHPSSALAVAISPDGKTLASGCERSIRIWDIARGRERSIIEGHKGQVLTLAFSPDGHTLVSGSRDNTVSVWTVAEGQPRLRVSYQWPVGAVFAVAVAPDGLRAACAGDAGPIWVWDLD